MVSVVWTPAEFRDLVSGNRRGLRATGLRLLLRAAEGPYAAAVRLRNLGYEHHVCRVHRVEVPVISVGNLTLGGTGKTPMVAWLAHWLGERRVWAAIVSRGYGARAGQPNDEAQELAWRLPGVPHYQDPDRVAAARRAIATHASQVILLDDGFQHRRLRRDLDIVLIDALEPFGFGHVFPRGTLREPFAGLSRAGVVALSRADVADPGVLATIRASMRRDAPTATCCELAHVPDRLLNASAASAPLATLAGRRLAAFCGIGNPGGFAHTLRQCGYQVVARRQFGDHHAYTPTDLDWLSCWAADADAEAVVCTHKDLVKVRVDRLGSIPLWAVLLKLDIVAGRPALAARLEELLGSYGLPRPD